MNRAELRRRKRTQALPQSDSHPLIDYVVYGDSETFVESLPGDGRHTVQRCHPADGPAVQVRARAAARGSAPYIGFVNSDAELVDPLALAMALAYLNGGAGVVGPLLIGPDGKCLAAGYAFSLSGRPYLRFNGWSADHPKVTAARGDIQAVPWTFMVVRREVWRIVRFAEDYGDLAYSDADFCVRAHHHRRGGIVYEPAIKVKVPQLGLPPHSDIAVQLLRTRQPVYDEVALL